MCTGAQPRCEAGPACWPRPGLPAAKVFTISREDLALCRLPCKPRSSSACSFRGSTFANPKAVHLEAKYSLQHVAPESGFMDKLWNGFSVSVFLQAKGTNNCIDPFVLKPLLHSPYLFLTFCLWGVCYIIIMSSDDLSNYITYR